MIYIATIHWKADRWIKLQHEFLRKNIHEPYQVFAYLNGISKELYQYFDHFRDNDDPPHAQKLNILAQDILRQSQDPSDIIIFLDGDAFPIAEIDQWIHAKLKEYPLIAVQRAENVGGIQPHPCFCASTVGFWKTHSPDWSEGYTWKGLNGLPTTDVGAGILELLIRKQIPWKPLLRTNALNLHLLLFGIYDDLIYHHGAGFREPILYRDNLLTIRVTHNQVIRFFKKILPGPFWQFIKRPFLYLLGRSREKRIEQNTVLSENAFRSLMTDPDRFIAKLQSGK